MTAYQSQNSRLFHGKYRSRHHICDIPFLWRMVKPTEAPPARLSNSIIHCVSMGSEDVKAATNSKPAATLAIRHESGPLDGNNPAHAIAARMPSTTAAAGI